MPRRPFLFTNIGAAVSVVAVVVWIASSSRTAGLGPRSDAESLAGLRARRPVLGEGPMILRLTPKTAVGLLG